MTDCFNGCGRCELCMGKTELPPDCFGGGGAGAGGGPPEQRCDENIQPCGLPGDEPLIRESVDAGCDLVTASGDKLIGGPQMGIIVGTRESVARVRAHPLYRALRCDKLSLIAMEATLRLFLVEEKDDGPLALGPCAARAEQREHGESAEKESGVSSSQRSDCGRWP